MIERDTDRFFDAVCRELATCRGKARAVTINDLCLRVGCTRIDPDTGETLPDRRTMEALIETRFADFPFLLTAGGRGYFIPSSAEEINRYVASLRSRAVKEFIRRRTVIRKALAAGYPREGKQFVDRPGAQAELFVEAGQ